MNKLKSFLLMGVLILAAGFNAFGEGLPNVSVELLRNKVHHAGVAVLMDFVFTNNGNKPVSINLDANPFESNQYAKAEGDGYTLSGLGSSYNFTVEPGEDVKRTLYVDNFPYNIKKFDSIKVAGRSSVTSQSNPYGQFSYTFQDINIPSFPNSNRKGCYFLDNEFDLSVDKIEPVGKDLSVTFTLTNNGKRQKSFSANNNGKATDMEGDEYQLVDSELYSSTDIPSGESIKRKVIVKGGAGKEFKKGRIMYDIFEYNNNNLSYPVLLQLDNLSTSN